MKREETFIPGGFYSKGYTREQALESVGAGWAGLIHTIFDMLQSYNPPIIVDQVKEKYGGLRMYTTPYVEDFEKFIIDVEKKSFTICETCGQPGQLRKGGWYKTLCDEHANGREPTNPF